MEFKQAMRVIKRICTVRDDCEKCELELNCPFVAVPADDLDFDEVEAILAKWAAEHPEKTIADDFYEKHPNAPGKQDKQPLPCAVHCGYIDKCPDDFSALECKKCWRRPLEEAER